MDRTELMAVIADQLLDVAGERPERLRWINHRGAVYYVPHVRVAEDAEPGEDDEPARPAERRSKEPGSGRRGGKPRSPCAVDILIAVREAGAPMDGPAILSAMRETGRDYDERTFYRHVGKLQKDGYLKHADDVGYYLPAGD